MMATNKKCNKCQEIKKIADFYRQKSTADGYMYECKKCKNLNNIKNKQNNLAKYQQYDREWKRKHYQSCPNQYKERNLLKSFNLSLNDFYEMLEQQKGVCCICNQVEKVLGNNGKIKSLSVDHDHKTNQLRGLLCNNCNRALGLLKDDPLVLRNAVLYLMYFKFQNEINK